MEKMAGGPTLGGWKLGLAAAVGGVLIGGLAVALYYGVRVPSRAETEAIVHNYILEHGEILPKAMERLEQRQAASVVSRQRAAFERPWHGAWAGAANGDVVLVEFFDYACSFCRVSNPVVERLLREDPRLKVVWRELPVLGPDSQAAAYVSLGAARQGRFRQFHDRMFALGRPSEGVIAQSVQETGVRREAESAEARAELTRNIELARSIGASGTPTFVVGDQVLQGAVGYEALKAAIAAARSGG
jgi:protein-disulfide isomerase